MEHDRGDVVREAENSCTSQNSIETARRRILKSVDAKYIKVSSLGRKGFMTQENDWQWCVRNDNIRKGPSKKKDVSCEQRERRMH